MTENGDERAASGQTDTPFVAPDPEIPLAIPAPPPGSGTVQIPTPPGVGPPVDIPAPPSGAAGGAETTTGGAAWVTADWITTTITFALMFALGFALFAFVL